MTTSNTGSPTITYLLFNFSYFLTMGKPSRSSSPLDHDYESYENTRENTRGAFLQTEYDTRPLVPGPKPSEKKGINPHTDRIISRIRLSLRILSFCLSASIVGALSHVVALYLKTKNKFVTNGMANITIHVWLSNLKTRPTFVLLGVASAATLISGILIVASFSRAVRAPASAAPQSRD